MSKVWVKPALLVSAVVVLGVLVTLSAYGLMAVTAPGPGADTGGTTPAAEGATDGAVNGSGSGVRTLPGKWSGYEWYDKELRDNNSMAFRNASAGDAVRFEPKEMNNSTLPENENRRELVKEGRKLFADTSKEMPKHTGGDRMSCANCHGGGALPTTTGMVGQDIDMIPLVGTAAGYPEWTGRTSRMRDMRQRIMGCFLRSMNADDAPDGVPAYDSREIQAMEAYMVWLNKDTPSQMVPYWRHLNKPTGEDKVPVPEVNPVRGADLYMENCASCHGADGQGTAGQYPPLWGPDSFNDGAGMGRIYTSSAFIREAMPYGAAHTLTDWRDVQDIAGYMNGHDRPHLSRMPKDYSKGGPPKEGVYYKRTQEQLGYDMNPMTKKLMLAGIPTGTQPLKESQIPEDTSRYEKPLRDATVEGAGSGGGGGGNSGNATSTSTPSPESTPTPTSTTNPTQSALADAMTGSEAESGG